MLYTAAAMVAGRVGPSAPARVPCTTASGRWSRRRPTRAAAGCRGPSPPSHARYARTSWHNA